MSLVGFFLSLVLSSGTFTEMSEFNCLVIVGPTASGKTKLAVRLASEIPAEIISADSRQVYRGLDIGTGKDLSEYTSNGKTIPYHLIDIAAPEEQFYLHEFVAALEKTFNTIRAAGKIPIICGGTGLYLDALQNNFELTQIPENPALRNSLSICSLADLQNKIATYPADLTAQVDVLSHKRLIRGIEIAEYCQQHAFKPSRRPTPYHPFYIGLKTDTESRRAKIKARLHQRIKEGLIEETQSLLNTGLSHERLQKLGLEYKFISLYLLNKLTRSEFEQQLETAIQQYAKRQMTWFRKMERSGCKIHWVDADSSASELLGLIEKNTDLLIQKD